MGDRSTEIEKAMWEGDLDTLCRLAGCICCCSDHTYDSCPARVWGGCRGQGSMTRAEEKQWAAHYAKHHGLSEEEFFGFEASSPLDQVLIELALARID